MSQSIAIKANEHGLVRVFALSLSPEDAKALKGEADALQTALGTAVDAAHVEVFPLADLGDMSLADYLIEGPGVAVAALEADRRKLAALEGWVMIVYSSAVVGAPASLNPVPELTLIGTYAQEGVDWTETVELSSSSALPYQDTARDDDKKPSDAAMAGRVATVALLVLFALVGLMVWVGS